MPAIVNAAAHRLDTSVGGTATAGGNLSLPQPPVHLPASATELVDEIPTEFGGLTHLFGGGSPAESLGQFLPVNVALEQPGGAVRGVLGGLKPDFRNAAQKVQQAISSSTPPATLGPPTSSMPATLRQTWSRFRQWAKI